MHYEYHDHANKIIQIPHAGVEILALVWEERINVMHDNTVVNLISQSLGRNLGLRIALVLESPSK